MPKFVIVYHYWWVDSKDWDEEVIEAENIEEARKEAKSNCYGTRYKKDYHIIKSIEETEELRNRKLSLKERLFGKIIED